MKTIITLVVILGVGLGVSKAGEPESEAYLIPLSPFDFTYQLQIRAKKVIFGDHNYTGMVVSPSFQNYYAVDLSGEGGPGEPIKTWVVTKYISDVLDVNHNEQEKRIAAGKYTVKKAEKNISADLAEKVFGITEAVVKKARYPQKPEMGYDGATYIFSISSYSGSTWCPSVGEPAQLVTLWDLLGEYASSKEEKAGAELLRRIEVQIDQMKYLVPANAKGHVQLPEPAKRESEPNQRSERNAGTTSHSTTKLPPGAAHH